MRVRWVALLLAGGWIAGCVDAGSDDAARGSMWVGDREYVSGLNDTWFAVDWPELAFPTGSDHDHTDPSHHVGLSTPNFRVLGHDPLTSDHYGKAAGGNGCSSAVDADGRRIAITNSVHNAAALTVVDVTDPLAPAMVGELVLENAHVYDNALTPDLRYAVLGTSPYETGPDLPLETVGMPVGMPKAMFRDACTGITVPVPGSEWLPFPAGLVLVDLLDPRAPAVIDYVPLPVTGTHSLRAFDVDGRNILLASINGQTAATGYFELLEIIETPAGAKMLPLSVIQPPEHTTMDPAEASEPSGHDGWIQRHPNGQWLAYLADVYLGAFIANIDDLTAPKIIGQANPRDVFGRDILVHGLEPIAGEWDGRHYTIGHEECPTRSSDAPGCFLWILDTTDPTKPLTVGAWTLPVDNIEWTTPFQFSFHYTALRGTTLFVTAYHAGLWAIDLSDFSTLPTLDTVGVFMPDRIVETEGGHNPAVTYLLDGTFDNAPTLLDVDVMPDGTLVLFDMYSGLYTVAFDDANPAPPPTPWPMDAYKFG